MSHRQPDPALLVDLAVDGALTEDERPAALAAEAGLADERRRLERLHAQLSAARVAARPGFAAEVMAALPVQPAWARASRPARALVGWRAAAAVLAVLAVVAMVLLGRGSAGAADAVPALGALAAIGEFAAAAALSGAGLISASWRGIGFALGEALDLPAKVVFAVGVVGLNGVLLLLLRRRVRRRAAAAAPASRRR